MAVEAIPKGFHTVTPYLRIKGAAAAIELYKKAFGAVELYRMPSPDGSIGHAEIRIGDSILMLGDEFPGMGALGPASLKGTTVGLHLYFENVNAAWDRAVAAGMTVQMPLQDMFWGDRYGKLVDPFGHEWSLGQHLEDVTPQEMARRWEEAMKNMPKSGC